MKLLKTALTILFTLTAAFPAHSIDVSREQRDIKISISQQTGHLLDWSQADRQIVKVLIDNPETFTKKIVFSSDGCNQQECNNAHILLISARPAAGTGHGGMIRVLTVDKSRQMYIYNISIKINGGDIDETETRFIRSNIAGKP